MVQVAISLQDVKKTYLNISAVDGVTFDVYEGEIFGLLGPNGAGKTTLISMLTGLFPPSQGRISIQNKSFSKDADFLKLTIGVVPQSLSLYPTLSALDNLHFFGGIYGLAGQKLKKRIQTVLEIVGLTDRAKDVVETYSGGMKRRLNLAIGLIHEPRVLFLDEPTVGVDPQSRNAIFEAIENLNRSGLTVIYTTHYMEEAERLCHRVAIMDQGKIVALDTPPALRHSVGEGFFRAGIAGGDVNVLLPLLKDAASIRAVSLRDSMVEIEAKSLQEALMFFMSISNQYGLRLTSLNIHESNLETVFLKLTGKKLRDHQ